jgi:hypothetical protein
VYEGITVSRGYSRRRHLHSRSRRSAFLIVKRFTNMKLIKTISATLMALCLPIQSAQAVFYCDTAITRVLVYADGTVNVLTAARADYTVICNLATPLNGVDITTCAAWTSLLQSIKRRNGVAFFYYQGTGTCATLATSSSAPTPYYIADSSP